MFSTTNTMESTFQYLNLYPVSESCGVHKLKVSDCCLTVSSDIAIHFLRTYLISAKLLTTETRTLALLLVSVPMVKIYETMKFSFVLSWRTEKNHRQSLCLTVTESVAALNRLLPKTSRFLLPLTSLNTM